MFRKFIYVIDRHKTLFCALCLFAVSLYGSNHSAFSQDENIQKTHTKIYMLHADTWTFQKAVNPDAQVFKGNVVFRHDSAYMYCDSAYLYEKTNSLDAFGNVRMEQGDTLFVYGDVLYYNGINGLARLRGNVKMINRDVTLITDSLNYDREQNIGYFFEWGQITDSENKLTSSYGQYSPDTKESEFQENVELDNPKFKLFSDTLQYNTASGMAQIVGPSTIVSDSNTIYSDRGWYDTKMDLAMLLDDSRIVSKTQELTGDTIYYDRKSGYGEVFGNMFLNDTLRKIILEGDYGYYNEKSEYAFITDRALATEYSSVDSLFLHADTLRSEVVDSARIMQAYYGVRFYRKDAQGVCDSLKFNSSDSILIMYRDPVVWNQNFQIFGDTIFVHMNGKNMDKVKVKDFAFLAQQKTKDYYDQLSGRIMDAYFVDGKLRQMDMNGNVETIFYPQEKDRSFIGMNKSESSFFRVFFKDNALEKLVMWPEVSGSLTPIPMLDKEIMYLPSFKWFEEIRPKNREDVFASTFEELAKMKDENNDSDEESLNKDGVININKKNELPLKLPVKAEPKDENRSNVSNEGNELPRSKFEDRQQEIKTQNQVRNDSIK
ncbi:MAG: OstA-like protein [Bacteroidales bacterium]|nr:OstA-like protein [Bacteroidales bacterium]